MDYKYIARSYDELYKEEQLEKLRIIKENIKVDKKDSLLDYQLIIEIDASQGDIVQKLAINTGFTDNIIKKDQFDRDRTLWAK